VTCLYHNTGDVVSGGWAAFRDIVVDVLVRRKQLRLIPYFWLATYLYAPLLFAAVN